MLLQANTAPVLDGDDLYDPCEDAVMVDTARTMNTKPAILGEVGTIRMAPYADRPTRPSSRASLLTKRGTYSLYLTWLTYCVVRADLLCGTG